MRLPSSFLLLLLAMPVAAQEQEIRARTSHPIWNGSFFACMRGAPSGTTAP